ncbi:pseudouridine synthase [Streptomyces sp. NPDC059740]|uniref:pseudouridine synthase n=1 Tax=Streptomyces sp. NPDC059740 TaxID=3346926 RepID=UPI00364D9B79
MARGRRATPPPLPQRDGVDPVRVHLPEDRAGRWPTAAAHLMDRFSGAVPRDRLAAMVGAGRFVTADGPLTADTPYRAGLRIWFHRDLPPEPPVPFEVEVVHRDERIVVADKPHFLATTPRGSHVTQTATARLRTALELPTLQAAHRLDRLTAGLVLFVVRPEDRAAYQGLFRDRRVHKEYEAVAPHDPGLRLPTTVRNRIEKERGVLAAREVPGPPNSESRIELLAHRAGLGRYRLLPTTGRTHQLRLHLSGLGLPILGDPLYPEVRASAPDDWTDPLQLLARRLAFTDPVTGEERDFVSRRTLSRRPDRSPG